MPIDARMAVVVVKGVAVAMLAVGAAGSLSGCQWRLRHRIAPAGIECEGARATAIETIRDLGYAVVGVYDPMPGRLTVIAAEKTTPEAHYQANVTVACEDGHAEVTAVQPTLVRHASHFEDDFRVTWEGRSGGVVRPFLAPSRPLEVTRGTGFGLSPSGAVSVAAPASAARATGVESSVPAATAPPEPADHAAREAVSASPPTATSAAAPPEQVAKASPLPTAPLAESPTVRFDLFSPADARARFGADLASAGLMAARLAIVNRTARAYLVSVPLVTVRRPSGESVAPLTWNDASARIAQSPVGKGWKSYDDLSRELASDQVLEPGASLSGILLYPAAEYGSVQILLIDQRSARSERFEGAIPPSP